MVIMRMVTDRNLVVITLTKQMLCHSRKKGLVVKIFTTKLQVDLTSFYLCAGSGSIPGQIIFQLRFFRVFHQLKDKCREV